jgi:putative inorganic carbon (HCO3(-)) transporter
MAVSITLAQAVLAVLALRLLYRLATGRADGMRWPLAVPLAAFTGVTVLAALASAHPLEGLLASRNLLLAVVLYVLIDALTDAAAAAWFVRVLVAAVTVVAALSVAQVALCPTLGPLEAVPGLARFATKCARAHGFYSIYMTLAGVLSLTLVVSVPRRGPWTTALGQTLAWLVNGTALLLTYTRGAWLGCLVGVGAVVALRKQAIVLGTALLVAMIAAVVLLPGVRQRAESIVDPRDPTARDRLLMWRSGWAMALDHPLLGVGPGQVKHVFPRYAAPDALRQTRSHLHNTPLQILVERGALGLAAWAGLYAAFFWQAGRRLRAVTGTSGEARALVTGAIGAVLAFLVGGLTEYNFGDSEVALLAYTLMALPFIARARPDEAAPPGRPSDEMLDSPPRVCP